jgi:hypothetical protein
MSSHLSPEEEALLKRIRNYKDEKKEKDVGKELRRRAYN